MSDGDLRATLAELHGQLEESEPLDAGLREELRRAVAEIEEHLGSPPEGGAGETGSFGQRLSQIVERFEGDHPRIAEAVNRVIHGLAELGI